MSATPNTVTVIRKAKFSAAHFLRLPELSDAENLQRFGPSSNPLGHGHNYEIEVSVQGPVQAETGMVMNLKDLKIILQEEVVEPLDIKNQTRECFSGQDPAPSAEPKNDWERPA